ncbi:MAG: hypothetical protein WCD76_01285 [Pyrinomonadaceae bacterium]
MSEGRGHLLPLWLRENFLLFGGAAVALVVFVGTLAFIVGRPKRTDATQVPRSVFQDLKVVLGDRGTVDLQTKGLAVSLKFSGLPEEAARGMTVKVSIDGADAQVGETGVGPEVQASALLSDQIDNIVKTNGVGAVLLVKGTCEYGGAAAAFDVSATRMRVVTKTEKELELAFDTFPELVPKPAPKAKPTPTPTPASTPEPLLPEPPLPSRKGPSSTPTPLPTPAPNDRLKDKPPSDTKDKPPSVSTIDLRMKVAKQEQQVQILQRRLAESNSNSPDYYEMKRRLDEAKQRLNFYRKQLNRPEQD